MNLHEKLANIEHMLLHVLMNQEREKYFGFSLEDEHALDVFMKQMKATAKRIKALDALTPAE